MKKSKKIVDIASYILLGILTTLLIMAVVSALTGSVFPLLIVKSGSMEPVLERGDIILIEKVDPKNIVADPVKGDIIVFYKPGTDILIVHRAIQRTSNGFITKGDANNFPDAFSPISPEYIVGRWTGIKIPSWTGLGLLLLFLKGEIYAPYGKIVLITLLIINVILIVRDIFSRLRRSAQKEQSKEY